MTFVTQHPFVLTLSRGEHVRVLVLRPFWVFTILAVLGISGAWSLFSAVFCVFHKDITTHLLAREFQLQADYEARLAELHADLDRVNSQKIVDENSFEDKMRTLLARQTQLEHRSAALTALVTEAGEQARLVAHSKDHACPMTIPSVGLPSDSDMTSSPLPPTTTTTMKPRPLDDNEKIPPPPKLRAEAPDSPLDYRIRTDMLTYALDEVEHKQLVTAVAVGTLAKATIGEFRSILTHTGLDAARITPPTPPLAMGGPYIPIEDNAFSHATISASKALIEAQRLRLAIAHLPLRYPLSGQFAISSPFGYRLDPFFGRPALHPGIDFVQPYGTHIQATGIGRVIHAGPEGGYGNAVDIDHGNGIVTRYGHLDRVLVHEGENVKTGDAIGRLGSTGRSTGPHLHYEVRIDGEPVNPERFLLTTG